jgi:hypothetical protein
MNTFKNQCKGGMHPIIRSSWYKEGDHVRAKGKYVELGVKDLIKTETEDAGKKTKTVTYTFPPCICGIPDFYGVPNTILVVFHPRLGLSPAYVEVGIGSEILEDLDVTKFSEKEVKDLKWVARFFEVV